MRLINNFKFSCFLLILLYSGGQYASAQENPVWDKPALRDSVIALLSRYEDLHNRLNSHADATIERNFMRLFANPKVQVINDLDVSSKPGKISIEDFISRVVELFPDGISTKLDLSRLSLIQPRYDRNNRYIIKVHINRSIKGISGGKVISSSRRLVFHIAFDLSNNIPDGFSIYGMDLPPKSQSYLTAIVAPAFTGYVNSALNKDLRIDMVGGAGYTGGLQFSHYFTDHWGLGTGARFSQYSGSVRLDKFDTFGAFDPNLRDVVIDNHLWFAEMPIVLSYRTHSLKRLEFMADIGVSVGFRVFETMSSTALNANTGITRENVISDAGWISLMNRVNFGFQATAGVKYRINERFGIVAGFGMRQGLSGLDKNIQADFASSKYLGQYNPLWGADVKTDNQSFFLNLGVTILLSKEQSK